MKRSSSCFWLFFLFLGLLPASSFSSATIDFHQYITDSGVSVITNTIDFSTMSGYFTVIGGNFAVEVEQKFLDNMAFIMPSACDKITKKDRTIECGYDGLSLYMRKNFTAKDGYYSFETEEGLPYKKYKLTVYKLPVDKFGKPLQSILQDPDVGDTVSIVSSASAIDLRKSEDNAISASGFELLKIGVEYRVAMPANVESAYAGNYTAQIDDNVANFDVVSVMKDSAPLVIISKELNLLLISVSICVILILLVAFLFFFGRK